MKLFRTATAALVLGGLVLGMGLPAMAAQGDNSPRGDRDGRGPGQSRLAGPELLRSMDLTPEQKSALWDLFQENRGGRKNRDENGKVHEMMEKIHAGQDVGVGLRVDAEKEIAGRIMERQAEVAKLYGILTEEQRKTFEKTWEERGDERQERFGERAGRRPRQVEGQQHRDYGQGEGQGQGNRPGKGRRDGDGEGRHSFTGRMADELELTEDQKAQIDGILEDGREHRTDRREEARERRDEHREMFRLAWTAEPDMDKLQEAAEKTAAEQVQWMLQGGEAMKKVRSVLTPEQQKKLDSCMEDHEGRFGPRGQRR